MCYCPYMFKWNGQEMARDNEGQLIEVDEWPPPICKHKGIPCKFYKDKSDDQSDPRQKVTK